MHNGEAHPTRFVILAAPRTGSNMLCTLLNSHPEILCHHEIFNPEGIFYALGLRDGSFNLGTIEERDSDPEAFLGRAWESSCGYKCVGFKLTHRQNETIFYKVLMDPKVKKIILRRENRIKTFVSWLMSQKTGQWELYSQPGLTANRPKVKVDLRVLRQHIEYNHAYYSEIENYLTDSSQPFLRTVYEHLFCDEERLRLTNFLGVSADVSRLKIESVKQNSCDLRDLVSNYSEIEKEFDGSEMETELRSVEF